MYLSSIEPLFGQAIPTGARVVLFGVLALLVVIVVVLVAFAFSIRRRARDRDFADRQNALVAMTTALAESPSSVPKASYGGTGLMAAVTTESLGCPSCGQQYGPGIRFCPVDARPLLAAQEARSELARGSHMCPHCRRAFAATVRSCPDDGSDLVPMALFEVTRGRITGLEPLGVVGRICPQCRRRYDLAVRFCAHDGAELASLN